MRRVAVITGSRADFGLLRSTMDAIETHPFVTDEGTEGRRCRSGGR